MIEKIDGYQSQQLGKGERTEHVVSEHKFWKLQTGSQALPWVVTCKRSVKYKIFQT